MSELRRQLQAQLDRFDNEGLAALANRGLLRRAQKDLERLTVEVVEQGPDALVVAVGEQRVRFDIRGPAQARCDCPASGVCQHILAAAIGLKRLGAEAADAAPAAVEDPLAALRESLLAVPASELVKHAGKAGYRWAWQYVNDLSDADALQIGGQQHLVLSLQRPRLTLRYMGGALDNLIADAEIAQLQKYRVAAVLAFQRAHGRELTPPEPSAAPRTQALDLGVDHQLAATGTAARDDSRQRLRSAASQLFAEAVGLGLSHLSSGMHERFTTLAVWAQGAEYHRLALLLRRIADHIELLLQRAGGADEHRLLDELSLANALVDALDGAAARGLAPTQWVGRARTRYEETGALEVLGLGARAWRSGSGYVGLTMILWSPQEGFLSCTDARPETLRGFDPIARYKAAGPWSGLGAPQQATGRRLSLLGAQLNEAMRLSARHSTSATVLAADRQAWSVEQLKPWTRWADLQQSRGSGHGLLGRPAPMQDWVFLQPSRAGPCQFDETRQTLLWPLWDAGGELLVAELVFDGNTEHAMQRIEALPAGVNDSGFIVVAQLIARGAILVAEPLSLVRPDADMPVDALHFDGAPAPAADGLLARWRKAWTARGAAASPQPAATAMHEPVPVVLADARRALQRLGERGLPLDAPHAWAAECDRLLEQTRSAGLTAFTALAAPGSPQAQLLRMNYLRLEYESLAGDTSLSLE